MNTTEFPTALEEVETTIRLLHQCAELLRWLRAAAPDGVDWKVYAGYAQRMAEDAQGELNSLKVMLSAPDEELPF